MQEVSPTVRTAPLLQTFASTRVMNLSFSHLAPFVFRKRRLARSRRSRIGLIFLPPPLSTLNLLPSAPSTVRHACHLAALCE